MSKVARFALRQRSCGDAWSGLGSPCQAESLRGLAEGAEGNRIRHPAACGKGSKQWKAHGRDIFEQRFSRHGVSLDWRLIEQPRLLHPTQCLIGTDLAEPFKRQRDLIQSLRQAVLSERIDNEGQLLAFRSRHGLS